MTRGEEIFTRTNAAIEAGSERTDAFKELAKEYSITYDAVRGAYYTWKRRIEGGEGTPSRGRRRESTVENIVDDARSALVKGLDAVDRELAQADERAREAQAEAVELKKAAPAKKQAIQARLDALK